MSDQELTAKYIAALKHLIPDIACEWCEPECVLQHGYAADGILLLADRVKADLIVLGTRRFSRWFDSLKPGIAYTARSRIRCASCAMPKAKAVNNRALAASKTQTLSIVPCQ